MSLPPALDDQFVHRLELREVVRRRAGAQQLPTAEDMVAQLIHWLKSYGLPISMLRKILENMLAAKMIPHDWSDRYYHDSNPTSQQDGGPTDATRFAEQLSEYLHGIDIAPPRCKEESRSGGFEEIVERWKQCVVSPSVSVGKSELDQISARWFRQLCNDDLNAQFNPSELSRVLLNTFPQQAVELQSGSDEKLAALIQYLDTTNAVSVIRGATDVAAYCNGKRANCPLTAEQSLLAALVLEAVLRQSLSQELVGMSLSGGGIRSASFNMGLLQSLIDNDEFRGIDYLSTVSGGGYIGSHVSSVYLDPKVTGATLPLRTKHDRSQSDHIRKLLRGGNYLSNPLRFMDRYLAGTLASHVIAISALICGCVLVAMLWRFLDQPSIHRTLSWLSNATILDWNRPFIPAAAAAFVWLGLWGKKSVDSLLNRANDTWGDIRVGALGVAIMFFLIGGMVWLANPHINVVPGGATSASDSSNFLSKHQYVSITLLAILVLMLLPMLHPKKLLRSGQARQGYWSQLVFKTVSIALLCGTPLAAIFLLARLNVSGEATRPGRAFIDSDIVDWDSFWPMALSDQDQGKLSPAAALMQAMQFDRPANRADRHLLESWASQGMFTRAKTSPRSLAYSEFVYVEKLKERIAKHVDSALDSPGILQSVPGEQRSDLIKKFLTTEGMGMQQALSPRLGEMSDADEAARLKHLSEMIDRGGQEAFDRMSVREANHLLLRLSYPDLIQRPTLIRRTVVIGPDQGYRLWLFCVSLLVFAITAALVNLNSSSPHPFYQEQLAAAYIHPKVQGECPSLSSLKQGIAKGAPLQLIGATLSSITQKSGDTDATFIFSPVCCGSVPTGFQPTDVYENHCGRGLHLGSAMAISGAAVNPIHLDNLFGAFLMAILNLRLGQWVPSPAEGHAFMWSRPTALNLLVDIARGLCGRRRALCLLTDGGHYENLGTGQLIRRRCAVLIVSDAGQDGEREFADLAKFYRRARLDGVRIFELDGKACFSLRSLNLIEPQKQISQKQYMLGIVEYPDGHRALLIYIKPALTRAEELDLERHSRGYANFPHDPTSDVAYDEDRIESYRQLGYSVGLRVCAELQRLQEATHPENGERSSEKQRRPSLIALAQHYSLSRDSLAVENTTGDDKTTVDFNQGNSTGFVTLEAVPSDETPLT